MTTDIETVGDLIAALEKLPRDAFVFVGNHLVNDTERDRGKVGVLVLGLGVPRHVFIAKEEGRQALCRHPATYDSLPRVCTQCGKEFESP